MQVDRFAAGWPYWVAHACTLPTPTMPASVERGDDFDKDVRVLWSRSTKIEVERRHPCVTGKYAESLSERVVTKMDAITRDWVMMQESVCKDTVVRKVTPAEVYTKVAACMRVALVSQRTLVEVMRSPNKEQVFELERRGVRQIGRNSANVSRRPSTPAMPLASPTG